MMRTTMAWVVLVALIVTGTSQTSLAGNGKGRGESVSAGSSRSRLRDGSCGSGPVGSAGAGGQRLRDGSCGAGPVGGAGAALRDGSCLLTPGATTVAP
jgi:hypothetical protein